MPDGKVNAALNTAAGAAHDKHSVDPKELRRLHEAAMPKKVFMTKFGVGNGNCLAASTSTLTGIPIETFPDFKEPGWFHNYQAFLRERGWAASFVPAENGKSIGTYDGLMLGLFSIKYAGREVSEDHCVVIQSELTRKEHTKTGWSYETEFHLWHDPCPPEHSGFTEIGPLTGLILLTTNALPSLLDRLEAAEAEVARLKVALCKIQDEADFYSDAVAYTYVFEKIEKIAREAKG